jgi:hypothetical protein
LNHLPTEVNVFVLKRRFALCLALALGLALTATPAHATKGAPPGNNGTVKIDGAPFDDAPGAPNRNEPHVPCDFRIEFYNYEQDSTWNVTFEAWSPTGDHAAEQVEVVEGRANDDTFHDMDLNDDPAEGADADGIDHIEEYRLAFGDLEPHPQQGFHVKATALVDDPDPRGAENKHKVFWVEPCEPVPQVTEEETVTDDGSEEKPEKPEKPGTDDAAPEADSSADNRIDADVLAEGVERPADAGAPRAEVLGIAVERADAPAAAPPAPMQLARTGLAGIVLVPLAAALILAGAGLQAAARRRRPA